MDGAGSGRGMVKTSVAIKRLSGMKTRLAPSEVNAGFLFPPSGLRPPSPANGGRDFFVRNAELGSRQAG